MADADHATVCPHPPGPRGFPLVGVSPQLYRDTIGYFRRMRAQYGDVAQFPLPGQRGYLVSHPDQIKQVLLASEDAYAKGRYTALMRSAFGDGLLTAGGERWRRQRELLQPFFRHGAVFAWLPIVVERTTAALSRWAEIAVTPKVIDAALEMRWLMQDIMGRIMFGAVVPQEDAMRAVEALTVVNDNLLQHFFRQMFLKGPLEHVPTRGMRRFRQAMAEFDSLVERILNRTDVEEGRHLIAQFKHATYPDSGEPMSTKQFRDEVATFFFAGQETTANALAWTFFFLATRPEIQNQIANEAATALDDGALASDAVARLSYLESVINESLRLRPPAYALERHSQRPLTLNGHAIEADSLVVLPPCVTHMHPELWEAPEEFDPKRFDRSERKGRDSFAFFPFGGGRRTCIGMGLAMMEIKTIVAMVARTFRFELAPDARVTPKPAVTLRPDPGVPLLLTARS